MDEHRGHDWRKRFSPLALLGMIGGGFVLSLALAFVFGLAVLYLWNWLMPDIFGLPRIGYWQAWGLVLLAHILVKPGYGPGMHGRRGLHGLHGRGPGRGPWWREDVKERVSGEGGSESKSEQA